MIQPHEMQLTLPIQIFGGSSTTTMVWSVLQASYMGNLEALKLLIAKCPALSYAKYNYTPPVHLAVREGHLELVKFLLSLQAYDPAYETYPFQDHLVTLAEDRGHDEIVGLLVEYHSTNNSFPFGFENGRIDFQRNALEQDFEKSVDEGNIPGIEQALNKNPGLARDETFFWGEGIMAIPAKNADTETLRLLLRYRAQVPSVLKWAQFYYFKHYDTAAFLLDHGMSAEVRSWNHTTLLHDMAQKGDTQKAGLLLHHGADINAVDEEYQSTPLGLASRWGQTEMVEFLLSHGANPSKAGAPWATPMAWAEKKGFTVIHSQLERALK